METTERVLVWVCSCTEGTDRYLNLWRDLGKPLTLPAHETLAAFEALLDAGWIELHPGNATRFRLTPRGQQQCAMRAPRQEEHRATA